MGACNNVPSACDKQPGGHKSSRGKGHSHDRKQNHIYVGYICISIQSIENIQRFFTRKVLYKFDLEYKQRLSVLNLESLEYRRLKTHLVMYYKIIHNLIDLNCENFFKFSRHSLTRSHNLTLTKPKNKIMLLR